MTMHEEIEKKTLVYLVHGVGGTLPGVMAKAAQAILPEGSFYSNSALRGPLPSEGASRFVLRELVWNEVVQSPWGEPDRPVTKTEHSASKKDGPEKAEGILKTPDLEYFQAVSGHLRDAIAVLHALLTAGCRGLLGGIQQTAFAGIQALTYLTIIALLLVPGLIWIFERGNNVFNWIPPFDVFPIMRGAFVFLFALFLGLALLEAGLVGMAHLVRTGRPHIAVAGVAGVIVLRGVSLLLTATIPVIMLSLILCFALLFTIALPFNIISKDNWLIGIPMAIITLGLIVLVAMSDWMRWWMPLLLFLFTFLLCQLAPIVKVLSDIFQYISEPAYRDRLLNYFSVKMEDVDPGNTVVLVAHSLGTVITLDFLLNRSERLRASEVILVTCGSPIRRFFSSLFPDLFFPASLKSCVLQLRHKYPVVEWHNGYRPLDYIGMRLGLPSDLGCREKCVWSPRTFWKSFHTGYWGDQSMLRFVKEIWSFRSELKDRPAAVTANAYEVSHREPPPSENRFWPRLIIVIVAFILLMIPVNFVTTWREESRVDSWMESIRGQPNDRLLTLSVSKYRHVPMGTYDDTPPHDRILVKVEADSVGKLKIGTESDNDADSRRSGGHPLYYNPEALLTYAKNHAERLSEDRWKIGNIKAIGGQYDGVALVDFPPEKRGVVGRFLGTLLGSVLTTLFGFPLLIAFICFVSVWIARAIWRNQRRIYSVSLINHPTR